MAHAMSGTVLIQWHQSRPRQDTMTQAQHAWHAIRSVIKHTLRRPTVTKAAAANASRIAAAHARSRPRIVLRIRLVRTAIHQRQARIIMVAVAALLHQHAILHHTLATMVITKHMQACAHKCAQQV